MASIPIHIWSSSYPHLETPDWLLFDIDAKLSTTEKAVIVAREVGTVLREIGMRPHVKTSGQMGIHVVAGLEPRYTYQHQDVFRTGGGSSAEACAVGRYLDSRTPGAQGPRVY